MKQAQKFFFIICLTSLVSCIGSQTISSTTQNTNLTEDISTFRVKFNPKDISLQETPNKQPFKQAISPLKEPVGSINLALDTLLEAISENNKSFSVKGYRIQIYSGLDRKEAEKAMTDLSNARLIFDERPELEYNQPNFKVKVGNYLDKPKAYEAYYKIKDIFPSASILYERIKITRYK